MFKKENRLTKQKDFDNVFQNGFSSFNKILGVKVAANHLDTNRFGVIVSTKISKKATDRNKLKRKLREILKTYSEDMEAGWDIAVVALPPARDKDFWELKNICGKHFRKLKLIS